MEQISLIMLQQRLSTERSLLGPKSCANSKTPEEESSIIRVGQGGVVVYQYTRKKIHPNIPKRKGRYTLYLKFKESDILNTRI